MELKDYREQIDAIDRELTRLFQERMHVAGEIAAFKKANGLPVLDRSRERQKLSELVGAAEEPLGGYVHVLYSLLFELSRSYQLKLISEKTPLQKRIEEAVENTPRLFPPRAEVACQGVEGAYSSLACEKLFSMPNITYFTSFESVFAAVDQGLCDYGILPLENSTAGSVNKIYDLMSRYSFSIVRSTRLKVDHNLLAKPGTAIADVKEIFSHPQAISQCGAFLEKRKGVKITPWENTALAAKMVAESGRTDAAAIASHSTVGLYGLDCLAADIQDRGNNYTRFICISKDLEIYPGADKTSLMLVAPHRPGSLYQILARFYTYGLNIIKLESRPIPNRDFEFMFYFDLETSVYSEEFIRLIDDLDSICEEFQYLGSYSEVI